MPAVAGQFYPDNKKELSAMIDAFLASVGPEKKLGDVLGLILPHAGYLFSGKVAAFGYKTIAGRKCDTVIIIGDSHCEYFDGVAVWPEGFWETPLGKVEIDKDLAGKILSYSGRFLVRDSAHLFEHSIEVHLPFLQKVLPGSKILPLIFGSENKDWQILAEAITKSAKGKAILVIASSDMSHYPAYKDAKEADLEILEEITKLDPLKLEEKIRNFEKKSIKGVETFLCAKDAVKVLLEFAKTNGAKAEILKYANSGDSGGEKDRVVGYGAVAFFRQ